MEYWRVSDCPFSPSLVSPPSLVSLPSLVSPPSLVSGVDHQELVEMADSSLSPIREGLSTSEEASDYYGGQ